jgi:hypothetical protein
VAYPLLNGAAKEDGIMENKAIHLMAAVILVLAFTFTGCGGNEANYENEVWWSDADIAWVSIDHPALDLTDNYEVSVPSIRLHGDAFISSKYSYINEEHLNVDVTWNNQTSGETGVTDQGYDHVDGSHYWKGEIPLTYGDNHILITAESYPDGYATDSFTVTHGRFPPNVVSNDSYSLTNGCELEAVVDTKGIEAEIWFEWSTTQDFANFQSTSSTLIQPGYFYRGYYSESVYGLLEGTDYYFRPVVSNTHGAKTGPVSQCSPVSLPIVSMGGLSGLWSVSDDPYGKTFTLDGWVNPLYDYETYAWFEYFLDTDSTFYNPYAGVRYAKTPKQFVGAGDFNMDFNATVTISTIYRILKIHYRICAENRTGSVCSDTYVYER